MLLSRNLAIVGPGIAVTGILKLTVLNPAGTAIPVLILNDPVELPGPGPVPNEGPPEPALQPPLTTIEELRLRFSSTVKLPF